MAQKKCHAVTIKEEKLEHSTKGSWRTKCTQFSKITLTCSKISMLEKAMAIGQSDSGLRAWSLFITEVIHLLAL